MDTHPRTSLISFCTVQLRTLCTAHSLATLCLSTTSGPDPGELPGFWGSVVFCHAPIPRKGSNNQQQQHANCGIIPSSVRAYTALLHTCASVICFKRSVSKRSAAASISQRVSIDFTRLTQDSASVYAKSRIWRNMSEGKGT